MMTQIKTYKIIIPFIALLVTACGTKEERDAKRAAREEKKLEKKEKIAEGLGLKRDSLTPRDLSFTDQLEGGDIIFVHSNSTLSLPISKATHSDYTHCGIYWKDKDGEIYVLEASDTSCKRPVRDFFEHTQDNQTLVLRLKKYPNGLNNPMAIKMERTFDKMLGLLYDGKFMWDDEKLYCSELVYKMYAATGIKLCPIKKIKDFDLSSPEVKAELKKRYDGEIPYNEDVVAPIDLVNSKLLDTVYYSK